MEKRGTVKSRSFFVVPWFREPDIALALFGCRIAGLCLAAGILLVGYLFNALL
jgi:hypothetical protein